VGLPKKRNPRNPQCCSCNMFVSEIHGIQSVNAEEENEETLMQVPNNNNPPNKRPIGATGTS